MSCECQCGVCDSQYDPDLHGCCVVVAQPSRERGKRPKRGRSRVTAPAPVEDKVEDAVPEQLPDGPSVNGEALRGVVPVVSVALFVAIIVFHTAIGTVLTVASGAALAGMVLLAATWGGALSNVGLERATERARATLRADLAAERAQSPVQFEKATEPVGEPVEGQFDLTWRGLGDGAWDDLEESVFVDVHDPEAGRNDLLWDTLMEALSAERARQ